MIQFYTFWAIVFHLIHLSNRSIVPSTMTIAFFVVCGSIFTRYVVQKNVTDSLGKHILLHYVPLIGLLFMDDWCIDYDSRMLFVSLILYLWYHSFNLRQIYQVYEA